MRWGIIFVLVLSAIFYGKFCFYNFSTHKNKDNMRSNDTVFKSKELQAKKNNPSYGSNPRVSSVFSEVRNDSSSKEENGQPKEELIFDPKDIGLNGFYLFEDFSYNDKDSFLKKHEIKDFTLSYFNKLPNIAHSPITSKKFQGYFEGSIEPLNTENNLNGQVFEKKISFFLSGDIKGNKFVGKMQLLTIGLDGQGKSRLRAKNVLEDIKTMASENLNIIFDGEGLAKEALFHLFMSKSSDKIIGNYYAKENGVYKVFAHINMARLNK